MTFSIENKITWICDDCGAKITSSLSRSLHFPLSDTTLCPECINERLQYSFKKHPIGRICPRCKGKKRIKEFYYHNEYNWIICDFCNGTGKLSL